MDEEFQPRCKKSQRMTADEISQLAEVFISMGVRKIRLTGGEPLIRKDARQIIRQLSTYTNSTTNSPGIKLAITTNGIYVREFLEDFKNANIHSVNLSLDTLIPERFEVITRRNYF